jgi:hypothetical protein
MYTGEQRGQGETRAVYERDGDGDGTQHLSSQLAPLEVK